MPTQTTGPRRSRLAKPRPGGLSPNLIKRTRRIATSRTSASVKAMETATRRYRRAASARWKLSPPRHSCDGLTSMPNDESCATNAPQKQWIGQFANQNMSFDRGLSRLYAQLEFDSELPRLSSDG